MSELGPHLPNFPLVLPYCCVAQTTPAGILVGLDMLSTSGHADVVLLLPGTHTPAAQNSDYGLPDSGTPGGSRTIGMLKLRNSPALVADTMVAHSTTARIE